MSAVPGNDRPARVLRIIARLNVGGPAHQVTLLSAHLNRDRFETLLVSGDVAPAEGSLDDLAVTHGASLQRVASLGPLLDPRGDARALAGLVAIVRRFRPDIVHTHTAKAGTLGRMAAHVAMPRRPVIVHTYHGHVLSGYFGPRQTAAFREVERVLARTSDLLIGVSRSTVEDLVGMRIAPRERFRFVPTGLDLDAFLAGEREDGRAFRAQVGVADDECLAVYVGRLVPIKRVDVLLEALALARGRGAGVHLAIVGDGELRETLKQQVRTLGIGDHVTFVGFRRDLPQIVAGSDLAVLSSDNEGIPVALIEAAAGGLPAVATDVGGVGELVDAEALVPAGDWRAFGERLARAASDPSDLPRRDLAARRQVVERFGFRRLVADVEDIYGELLAARRAR